MQKKVMEINGVMKTLIVDQESSLAEVLREQLGLTGTKVGCGTGQCGCCNVILDGKLVKSCVTKMKRVPEWSAAPYHRGSGYSGQSPSRPVVLDGVWRRSVRVLCPGFIVSAKALLDRNNNPSREEVREWFQKNRNACRCTGYKPIVDAVMDAAKVIRGEMTAAELAYKLPADGRIWGGTYPRPTAVAKATGTIDYGADLGCKMPAGNPQAGTGSSQGFPRQNPLY